MSSLRKYSEGALPYPSVILVHLGDCRDADGFFEARWPGGVAIDDASEAIFRAWGLDRGSVSEMFGPSVWVSGVRAMLTGHMAKLGKAVGDGWMMPGVYYTSGRRVYWRHIYDHAGDHPPWGALPDRFDRMGLPPFDAALSSNG